MSDSASTTKNLHTGERSSSVGRSDTFISHTDILPITHLNIPPPHDEEQVFMTSTTDPPSVSESTNQYSILPIEGTNDFPVETNDRVVRAPPKLTECLASNSSQAKASNEKTTTILSPILTTPHQSRPPPKEFQAAVTNARSDGVERASNATSDEAALLVGKVPPWGSSCAMSSEASATASPPLVTEWNARISKCKSPGKAEALTKTFPSRDQSWGLHP